MRAIVLILLCYLISLFTYSSSINEGIYELDVRINGNAFKDKLTITSKTYSPYLEEFILAGTFEAPGAFVSDLTEAYSYKNGFRAKFLVKEGAKPYQKATIKGEMSPSCELKGTISIGENIFAYFKGGPYEYCN
ncbi:MAG: hypothetical protein GY909_18485 [Oligoflexia bacterium]|nr:hypothetical protein [Oligoflexia bacterium]